MSSPYTSQYYSTSGTLPMPVPSSKDHYASYYQSGASTYSASPPEVDGSITSASAVPSYSNTGYSVTTSYAGSSADDYESAGSASGIDFQEYMQDRFAESFNPIPLDKCTATQAKTSGHLNAKQRELLDLQKQAQARLAKSRARFQEGLQDARDVRADLEWTQKKVTSMKSKASRKHSKEYKKARERYPSPEY